MLNCEEQRAQQRVPALTHQVKELSKSHPLRPQVSSFVTGSDSGVRLDEWLLTFLESQVLSSRRAVLFPQQNTVYNS